MQVNTAYRQFDDWKRLGENFEKRYLFLCNHLRNNTSLQEDILKHLSESLAYREMGLSDICTNRTHSSSFASNESLFSRVRKSRPNRSTG